MIRRYDRNILVPNPLIGLQNTIYFSFARASENNNRIICDEISHLVSEQLFTAFGNRSMPMVNQFIDLPTFFYNAAKNNLSIQNNLVDRFSSDFKAISFIFRSLENNIPNNALPFLSIYYEGLLSFFHYLLEHKDEVILLKAINEFNNIIPYDFSGNNTRSLIATARPALSQDEKRKIRDNAAKDNLLFNTHRRSGLILLSWAMFMFSKDTLDEERLTFLTEQIKVRYDFFEDLLDDLSIIRNEKIYERHGDFSWDYIERLSGHVYSPPVIRDWILYGVLFVLIKEPVPHFSLEAIVDSTDYTFLCDAVEEQLNYFREHLEKWAKLLGIIAVHETTNDEKEIDIYNEKARRILNTFRALKVFHDQIRDKTIADQDLDQQLIKDTKENLFKSWQKWNISFDIFSFFGSINILDNTKGLQKFGFVSLLQRFKTMFVEQNYQNIHGLDDLGSKAAKLTDDIFLNEILKLGKDQHQELIATIDLKIKELKEKGFDVDLIIIPPEYIYQSELYGNENFKLHAGGDETSIAVAKYKNILVSTFYSNILKDQIVICDFTKAFILDLYESDSLLGQRLHVDIKALNSHEIEQQYTTRTEYWSNVENGVTLNKEQTKIRIATSVNLEIWSEGNFRVINPLAVSVFKFILK